MLLWSISCSEGLPKSFQTHSKPKKSPKPPNIEKSSQPKPPIILKKKAEESLETD
jgi:hypothetical protein